MSIKTIVIVGTGWGGLTLAKKIDSQKFKVVIISPDSSSPYTPLLASAACGLFDFSLAEEPVRRRKHPLRYIKAMVTDVDFDKKICVCSPAFTSLEEQTFEVRYNYTVVAPGCTSQTFGTAGVAEHALFVKNVKDAMAVRQRLSNILEIASLLNKTRQEQKDILHVIVVGGGPTGIEITAELYDLIHKDLTALYHDLAGCMTVAVHDVASSILSCFDDSLSEYALESLAKRDVVIKTGSHIDKVEKGSLYTKEDGQIPYGMLIWATGNKQVPLVHRLSVLKSAHLPRILTDSHLRIFAPDSSLIESAYALGDAADVKGGELPTTAEVACQKAKCLARIFNLDGNSEVVFADQQHALVTYLGQHDGVVGGKKDWSVMGAWFAWRSKNLLWARNWKTKILISINWVLNWSFGKEVARY